MTKTNKQMDKDKDFVIKIIQYLQNKYGIYFFITPKDFNTLYRWWEKRIPIHIVKEAVTNIVERWTGRGKKIYSFSNFNYEVKKIFQAFLQLDVGSERGDTGAQSRENENQFKEIEHFFNHYPEELSILREDFENIYGKIKNEENIDLTGIYEKLVDIFKDDEELNMKTGIFLKNLAPELRKSEIRQRYRLNYLINKFNIPDF